MPDCNEECESVTYNLPTEPKYLSDKNILDIDLLVSKLTCEVLVFITNLL